MEQPNSGDKLLIFDEVQMLWVQLHEVYFEEARIYSWRVDTRSSFRFLMQQVPVAMTRTSSGWEGVIETPFQSGLLQFKMLIDNLETVVDTYCYSDSRKMTEHHYTLLLQEILEESQICFQKSGLASNVSASGYTRDYSLLQWSYIESSIYQLRNIFRHIAHQPLRALKREELLMRREKVSHATLRSVSWLERYGQSYGATPTKLPSHIQSTRLNESFNLYENRLVLRNILDLEALLKVYRTFKDDEIQKKAANYSNWIAHWKKADFLQGVTAYKGTVAITQVFRKHPHYRLWYQWFHALYQYNRLSFDIGQKLALKDTFLLYEMWCYLQIIKMLREFGLVNNAASLFTKKDDFYFLNLAENKESTLLLSNGAKLTYQKTIQINTSPYYSYTQRMIPDIVLENKESLYIFDPKYRVAANLPMALGEMHKYRDGILSRATGQQVVKEVYILTPVEHEGSDKKDFYGEDFQRRYGMGAYLLKTGETNLFFKRKMVEILRPV